MGKSDNISMSVIKRVPRYFRFISELREAGVTRVSSKELAQKMGLTASQVRQDFNCFGGFGQQGYGYLVEKLYTEMISILGIAKPHKAVLIGAGNLGRTIATQIDFKRCGFELVGIFDKNPALTSSYIRGIPIQKIAELPEFCKTYKPAAAILCLPRGSVQELAEQMISLGITNFWNFSHYDISLEYEGVVVENVHMSDSLMTLCYRINEKESICWAGEN